MNPIDPPQWRPCTFFSDYFYYSLHICKLHVHVIANRGSRISLEPRFSCKELAQLLDQYNVSWLKNISALVGWWTCLVIFGQLTVATINNWKRKYPVYTHIVYCYGTGISGGLRWWTGEIWNTIKILEKINMKVHNDWKVVLVTMTAKVALAIRRLTATKDGSKERNERNDTTFQLKLDTEMSKGEIWSILWINLIWTDCAQPLGYPTKFITSLLEHHFRPANHLQEWGQYHPSSRILGSPILSIK